jgi:hypothetical protein
VLCRPRTMEDLESKISRSRTGPYSVNGYLSFSLRMEYGKYSLRENMLAKRLYPRFFENQEIHIFCRTYGYKEVFIFIWTFIY